MYQQFKLFKSHLETAQTYWKAFVLPGDTVIDATCGNGHDTLALAKLALTTSSGQLFGFDIQEKAIEETRKRLKSELSEETLSRATLLLASHAMFPEAIAKQSVKLIVYNLGYLPGANKALTTQTETTLASLKQALELIQPGGAISVTCYPGHPEGQVEEAALLNFVRDLAPQTYCCTHQRWINRKQSPSLLLIEKKRL